MALRPKQGIGSMARLSSENKRACSHATALNPLEGIGSPHNLNLNCPRELYDAVWCGDVWGEACSRSRSPWECAVGPSEGQATLASSKLLPSTLTPFTATTSSPSRTHMPAALAWKACVCLAIEANAQKS